MLDKFRLAADFVWDRASKRVLEKVTLNEGDANGRKMRVQVVNNGAVENLTGARLNLAWVGRLGKGLDNFEVVDATKGIFELTFRTGMLNNTGSINASLQLILPSGSGIVESTPFPMDNRPSLVDSESAQSTDSWTALEEALANIGGGGGGPVDFSAIEQRITQTEQDLTAQLASVDAIALQGRTANQFMQIVSHGTNGSTARPVGALAVYWIGTATPANAQDNDIWVGG